MFACFSCCDRWSEMTTQEKISGQHKKWSDDEAVSLFSNCCCWPGWMCCNVPLEGKKNHWSCMTHSSQHSVLPGCCNDEVMLFAGCVGPPPSLHPPSVVQHSLALAGAQLFLRVLKLPWCLVLSKAVAVVVWVVVTSKRVVHKLPLFILHSAENRLNAWRTQTTSRWCWSETNVTSRRALWTQSKPRN